MKRSTIESVLFFAAVGMSKNASYSQGQGQWPPPGIAVSYPNSTSFVNETTRWNAHGSPMFSESTAPTSPDEVAEIVKAAVASKISFLAMGGRHAYGHMLSALQGGLAIDLSGLNRFSIDTVAKPVTIGGGAKIKEVINPVADAGFQIGLGACNCTGYVGTTLGAGIGYLQGTFGLVIDALVSVDFVTAEREQIIASNTSNPDLFWAIKGAGANFGIVTSATYKLSEPVNSGLVFHAELLYSAEQQEDYFKTMEAFEEQKPAPLGFSSAMFWNATTNSHLAKTSILSTFIYVGTEEAARSDLAPFFDLNPVVVAAENIPFQHVPNVVNGVTDASCQTSQGLHSIHTFNVRKWTASAFSSIFTQFDAYLKQYEEARSANSAIIMGTFSAAASTSVPDGSAAYPWRDSAGYIMLQMRWPGLTNSFGETANIFAKKLRDELAATSGYSGLSAYVNYAWGDETLEQIYRKDKLERLVSVKQKWDPTNVFGFSNGIAPNYTTK
ncbi:hypothetical protein LQW54_009602 [Pestalotiopsis sp. IQ-011]